MVVYSIILELCKHSGVYTATELQGMSLKITYSLFALVLDIEKILI